MAWYSAAEWERVKETVPDPERLEESYEAWESLANATMSKLERAGITAERVPLDLDRLLAWCKENDRDPDSEARAHFAAEELRRRDLASR